MILSGNGLAVTGTKWGMTEAQFLSFRPILGNLFSKYGEIFRHGDCVGVDDEAAYIVREMFPDVKIIVHPPENETYRAFNANANEILPQKPYLERDHDMVDLCDFLIGFPKTEFEQLRSGTWATIRYARKIERNHVLIWPDGKIHSFTRFRS